MNEVDIPRYVDSQPQLFFWEIDEAVIFIGLLGCGIAIGGWFTLLSIIAGYYAVREGLTEAPIGKPVQVRLIGESMRFDKLG